MKGQELGSQGTVVLETSLKTVDGDLPMCAAMNNQPNGGRLRSKVFGSLPLTHRQIAASSCRAGTKNHPAHLSSPLMIGRTCHADKPARLNRPHSVPNNSQYLSSRSGPRFAALRSPLLRTGAARTIRTHMPLPAYFLMIVDRDYVGSKGRCSFHITD